MSVWVWGNGVPVGHLHGGGVLGSWWRGVSVGAGQQVVREVSIWAWWAQGAHRVPYGNGVME